MNWRTANNRRRQRQQQATPAFVKRNLDRWRGALWPEIAKAITDERLGRKRKRVPVHSKWEVLGVDFATFPLASLLSNLSMDPLEP